MWHKYTYIEIHLILWALAYAIQWFSGMVLCPSFYVVFSFSNHLWNINKPFFLCKKKKWKIFFHTFNGKFPEGLKITLWDYIIVLNGAYLKQINDPAVNKGLDYPRNL